MSEELNTRLLIVDDNATIHEDFRKIFAGIGTPGRGELDNLLGEIFDDENTTTPDSDAVDIPVFEVDHAQQGDEAVELVRKAAADNAPYAVLFIDVRMPPGMNGIQTIARIWDEFPDIEVVICTAYSDYSWEQIQVLQQFGSSDKLLFLRKPFDVVSVKQMALALARKWTLGSQVRRHVEELEEQVDARTKELRDKIAQLEQAMAEIQQLQSILPMCSYCHKIRDDENYWQQVDTYIQQHKIADVSHGVCPECYEKHLLPMLEKRQKAKNE